MVRPIFYEAALFLLPFIGYALWLLWRRVNPATRQAWQDAPLLGLFIAALVCTVIGLGLVGHYGSAPAGSTYAPARFENGKLIEPKLE